jgi:hypothetical protein
MYLYPDESEIRERGEGGFEILNSSQADWCKLSSNVHDIQVRIYYICGDSGVGES